MRARLAAAASRASSASTTAASASALSSVTRSVTASWRAWALRVVASRSFMSTRTAVCDLTAVSIAEYCVRKSSVDSAPSAQESGEMEVPFW